MTSPQHHTAGRAAHRHPVFRAGRDAWRCHQLLGAIAENDDARSPKDKDVLKETFAKAGVAAEIEVEGTLHGWCPPDSRVYDVPQAERAWSRLLVLLGGALA